MTKKKIAVVKKGISLPWILGIAFVVGLLFTGGGFAFAATQEQQDSFCASCHTQPESTFYQREQDKSAADLASAHHPKEVRCIDCHSGAGVAGRIGAELLGAHNALAFITHTAIQPAKLTKPIGDSNCLKCHQKVLQGEPTENNHFHHFLARWQGTDPAAATCTSCHSSHTTDGLTNLAFLNKERTVAVCEACHRRLGEGD